MYPDITFLQETRARAFTDTIYNCVSRGQCAIIQRVQVITHGVTGRARAARCETQKLETAITRARMSCSARSDFSASESEDSQKDPFEGSGKELVIPSPVELSETDADASPSSQHRMEMACRQTSGRSVHEEEENNDAEEEDINDDEEVKSDVPLKQSKSHATRQQPLIYFQNF